MFRGAHAINLDNKGRFAIPTRYRQRLCDETDNCLICTVDIANPCLLLYPLDEWEEIERRLKKLSSMQPLERRLQRLLLGYASECGPDAQGRVHLTQPLREHAHLQKEMMLVGQLNKLEIWDKAAWHAQVANDIQMLPDADWTVSARLEDFSL